MMHWLIVGMFGCLVAIFALIGEMIKILKNAYEEARAPTYWLPREGARRSTSTGYFTDGADEPDGSSYAVVHGDVRLE